MTIKEFLEIQHWLKNNPDIKVEIYFKTEDNEAELRLYAIHDKEAEYITIGLPILDSNSAMN